MVVTTSEARVMVRAVMMDMVVVVVVASITVSVMFVVALAILYDSYDEE